MDVVSVCPFRVASLLWQRQRGGSVLTIVCKATFDLFPTQARLAQDQDDPNDDDNHWNDDPARSLYSPSDLVPFKVRADVLLVGYAFAPRGEQVRSIQTRLVVGGIDKAIEAYGERAFALDGSLREGARVTKVPLRYERAAGGPDTYNPVGIRPDAPYDAHGLTPLPNLQPPGLHVQSRGDVIPAVGYGPIAPSWPGRVERLGVHANSFSLFNLRSQPLPDEIDPSFFNCAPHDQQLDELRDNERIVLENLHPQQPRLVTSLPGFHPRVFAVRTGNAAQEVAVRCDTLWIDTDRQQCTLVWRGQLMLDRPNTTGRVVVAMEEANQRLAWTDVERHFAGMGAAKPAQESEPRRDAAPSPPPAAKPSRPGTLPFPRGNDAPADSAKQPPPPPSGPSLAQVPTSVVRPSSMGVPTAGGLPFVQQNSAAPAPAPSPAPATDLPAPGDAAPKWLSSTRQGMPAVAPPPAPNVPNATPFAPAVPMAPVAMAPAAPPPPPMAIPSAPPPPPMPASPPPMVPQPAAVTGSPLDSPWANPSARTTGDALPAVSMSGPSPVSATATAMASVGLGAAAAAVAFSSGSAAAPPPPGMVANAAGAGAAAASNAAAIATQWSSGTSDRDVSSSPSPAVRTNFSTRNSRDVIDLLWFDPKAVGKLREHPKWKPILDKLKPPPRDLDFDDAPPPEDPPEVRDKRDVFAVMTKADTTDAEGIQEAIADAVADDGTFTPPLVLVSGELSFPFDELETLKATVTAVTPLIAGDKKLKETVDTVNELLKTPWLQSSSGVAEGLTLRVKEAFAQGNRMLPPSYLDTHTDRMLLEQRHYQKRTVFGEIWIRSVLLPGGSQQPMPAYLVESLTKKLPMFQRFKARLIAEAHMQQDEYENHPAALKVVALGRVVAMSRRGVMR